MPILKGFPPSNLISPSVRIAEKDLSFLSSVQTGHRAGLVGFASKGPINIPTLITTSVQLHTVFGFPHPDVGDPYLLYAADQYLSIANELFVVRVADTSPVNDEAPSTASVVVPTAGGAVMIEGNIPVGSGWVFATDQFFRWRLNGVLASREVVVLAGTYTGNDLIDLLNAQISPEFDGIEFYLTNLDVNGLAQASSNLGVKTTFAFGPSVSIELVSVINSLYGPDSVVGMGTLMTAAVVVGTATQYPATSVPNPGDFDFSAFTADTLNLQIVIDGSDNLLIDNVVQVITLDSDDDSIADIVTEINDQVTAGTIPGGFTASTVGNTLVLTTNHVGRDAKMVVKTSSTAGIPFGFSNLTQTGFSPSCVTLSGSTYTCGIVTGNTNASNLTCFTVTADSPGIDGNNTALVINTSTTEGTFTISVFNQNNQVEVWGNLVKDPASSFYVESYIAAVSDYIRIVDNTATLAAPASSSGSTPYILTGGSDGIPADPDAQDAMLTGNTVSMTGLQALSDPEQIDIDLIAIPGHPSTNVVLALLDFAQTRTDCLAIIDSPFGLNVTEITQWQNGTHPLNDVRFDSDFGALYWPWVKTRDVFNAVDVWVPPSGSVMATIARSDSLAAPWFAPAGETRGLVPNILDVFSRPSLAERDSMYGNRNAINPIIQFVDLSGFHVWGQKTLQRTPSALDRVNVRRMMFFVEKQIRTRVRTLLFEPNDNALWGDFITIATNVLETVQSQRGITAFIVQCDATLNTPDVIDRNELHAKIGIQPTRTAEFIYIEFTINRTGTFAETSTTF